MKHCSKYKKKILWYYLRDQLDAEETARVQYHLFVCPECWQRMMRMRKLSDELSNNERIGRKYLHLLAAACLLALFVGGGYYYLRVPPIENEYPVKSKMPPVNNELDSVKLKSDSLLIKQDLNEKK